MRYTLAYSVCICSAAALSIYVRCEYTKQAHEININAKVCECFLVAHLGYYEFVLKIIHRVTYRLLFVGIIPARIFTILMCLDALILRKFISAFISYLRYKGQIDLCEIKN